MIATLGIIAVIVFCLGLFAVLLGITLKMFNGVKNKNFAVKMAFVGMLVVLLALLFLPTMGVLIVFDLL